MKLYLLIITISLVFLYFGSKLLDRIEAIEAKQSEILQVQKYFIAKELRESGAVDDVLKIFE
jgi:hypothetical protein